MVAIGVTFPSFTKALQRTHDGRMLPMGWWELLKVLKWHKTDTVDLLLIGVLPEYRKKGANSLIFNDLIKQFVKYGFKWAEAMPQMEDNKAVQSEWQYLESRQHRRHRCYTKSLE
jgi:GNAT superfamily N-acetyltransferase